MAFYEPGKPYDIPKFITGTNVGGLWMPRTKRVLGSEEYEYYHSKLEDDSLPEPVRAGVAVVLMADTKRWFGLSSAISNVEDEFMSPLTIKWVEKYQSYPEGSPEKNQGRQEIKKFDQYLVDSDPPGKTQLHSTIQESRKGFAVRLMVAKKEKEKAMSVEELLAQERQERENKEYVEEAKMQGLVIAEALEDHMRAKIREYLAGTFEKSIGKLFIDKKNSQREFALRMDLIKKVKEKKINPLEAISRYQKALDDFAGLKRDIPMTVYGHPIQSKLGVQNAN